MREYLKKFWALLNKPFEGAFKFAAPIGRREDNVIDFLLYSRRGMYSVGGCDADYNIS